MTLLEAPVTPDEAPPTGTGWFKVGQLTEQTIVSFGANPASLYLLLCKRVRYSGEGAGATAQPYSPKDTAALFGCSRRHLYDCLKTLLEAKAVRVRRTQDGFHVTIAGYPKPSQRRAAQVFHSQPVPEESGTDVLTSDLEEAHLCPTEAAQVCRSPFLIQESLNQEGGKTPIVEEAAAPAPPPVDFSEDTVEAIRMGEAARRLRFPAEVRTAIGYKLETLPAGARLPALRGAIKVMAEHPTWNQNAPGTWAGQVEKAAGAKHFTSWRSAPPEPPPPPPKPASRDTIEAARALLTARGLDKPNPAVRARFGAVA